MSTETMQAMVMDAPGAAAVLRIADQDEGGPA